MYLYAKAQQLKIPTDLAIIGQANQPIGIGMGISTVDHQLTKVGEQACSLVINKSRDKVKIPYRIIERDSV
jgi:DNA-binding LacI/PurR family transcriptional regulator